MFFSSDAIAGFIGVVTGGVVTGGLQWKAVRRKEARDERAARRLVRAELLAIQVSLEHGITAREWTVVMEKLADHSQWEANRLQLAREIEDTDEWNQIEKAYRGAFAAIRVANLPDGHVAKDESVYDLALIAAVEAVAMLDGIPLPPHPPPRRISATGAVLGTYRD